MMALGGIGEIEGEMEFGCIDDDRYIDDDDDDDEDVWSLNVEHKR